MLKQAIKALKIVLWSLLLISTGLLSGAAILNYTGYCLNEQRYWSNDELIRRGVDGALGHYPFISFVYLELPPRGVQLQSRLGYRTTGEEQGFEINPAQLIPYRDVDEFFAINPNCCSVTRDGMHDEVGEPSLWDKVTGYSRAYVNIKLKVRYRDVSGAPQYGLTAHSFNYTNCGHSIAIY